MLSYFQAQNHIVWRNCSTVLKEAVVVLAAIWLREKSTKMPGPIQAKNRAPAPIQITAEQLLREAKERGLEDVQKAPKQFITDKEELLQYQNAKRKDFEDQIRRNRHHIGIWCRYALWEAASKEFERSRSVFERALSECRLSSLNVLSVYAFKEVLMLIRTICLW